MAELHNVRNVVHLDMATFNILLQLGKGDDEEDFDELQPRRRRWKVTLTGFGHARSTQRQKQQQQQQQQRQHDDLLFKGFHGTAFSVSPESIASALSGRGHSRTVYYSGQQADM